MKGALLLLVSILTGLEVAAKLLELRRSGLKEELALTSAEEVSLQLILGTLASLFDQLVLETDVLQLSIQR